MLINTLIIIAIIIVAILLLIAIAAIIRHKKGVKTQSSRYIGEQVQIYVGNLPYRINEYDLKNYFSQYGEITHVRIVKNSRTGRSKGYAFVSFITPKEAKKALVAHGHDLKGRSIVVRIAKPPRQS